MAREVSRERRAAGRTLAGSIRRIRQPGDADALPSGIALDETEITRLLSCLQRASSRHRVGSEFLLSIGDLGDPEGLRAVPFGEEEGWEFPGGGLGGSLRTKGPDEDLVAGPPVPHGDGEDE